MKKYFWKKEHSRYCLCYDTNGDYHYYIEEIAVSHKDWTEEKRQRIFNGAKYCWGCTTSWYNPLKATNIEDAQIEFEKWYQQKLHNTITELNKRKEEAINDDLRFCIYLVRERGEKK